MISIEILRERIGLDSTDKSEDVKLTAAHLATMNIAENYLDRKLDKMNEIEEHYHKSGGVISLRRYPIETINSITSDGAALTDYQLDDETGLIYAEARLSAKHLVINYEGGFDEYPEDLELAILDLFDNVYSQSITTGDSSLSGAVSGYSIAGVGSIKFDTSEGSSWGGIMPATSAAIFDQYRRESV